MPGIDYVKLRANLDASVVTPYIGPSGGTTLGITDISQPTAAELNNTGGTSAVVMAAEAISWNDWDFGVSESETNNEPSMADISTYEEFGQYNYGGGISFFQPLENDDPSNVLSVVKELTKVDLDQDIAIRVDGNKSNATPAANGDYISVFRTTSTAVENPFTPGESKRRTVTFVENGDFAHYTVVGPHTLVAVPPATAPWASGKKARLRVTVQGRDYTNATPIRFTSSNSAVVAIGPGGVYTVNGAAGTSATITITDTDANTNTTVNVTVTAP